MSAWLNILAVSMSLGSASLLPTVAAAEAACDPRVLTSPTKFPIRSQLRGQSGVVLLNVTVDENGRATSAALHRSSGYRLLDRAAAASVGDWVFDVSDCVRKDLPANDVVAVEYRNDEYR